MSQTITISLPPRFTLADKIHGNKIRQLLSPQEQIEFTAQSSTHFRVPVIRLTAPNQSEIWITPRRITPPEHIQRVLVGKFEEKSRHIQIDEASLRWLKPSSPSQSLSDDLEECKLLCQQVRDSWSEDFFFKEELRNGDDVLELGLRSPQLGALYAALAHWTVTHEAATIAMPTGTGKTETMLALSARKRLERILVVVPTSPLREQITNKFLTLGILKACGVVGQKSLYPIVGMLEHQLKNPVEVDDLFQRCNVVVATMSVISGCSEEVQTRMADICSHLFIDEAHHIGAPSWEKFRRAFMHKQILQFTATPFRTDGKHVTGRLIYSYPLKKAQEEGYFKPINFRSIWEFDPIQADVEIARVAIDQLETDLKAGFDHLIMARADKIERAKEVYKIYEKYPQHNPVIVHSEQSVAEQRESLNKLRNRTSRIVVCVDMFGEGFDFPELKIAALHQMHKSLGITLQFTGRFTRVKDHRIGDATMIANIADANMEGALRDLYAEDADWNLLLRQLSTGAIGKHLKRAQFKDDFVNAPPDLPLQNIYPKMSTVVYKTKIKDWRPEKLDEAFKDYRLYTEPAINNNAKVAVIVTVEHEEIPWGDIRGLQNTYWNLYLFHWDSSQNLLFIHSSDNRSLHVELAQAICGDDVELIRDRQVFRCLHGINRLMLSNLGLKHSLSRAVRFTMYAGSDVRSGIAEAQLEGKTASNMFGFGFENGYRASAGCSGKGRIWSYKVADDISEWVDWCHHIGAKILDSSIDVRDILGRVLVPETITQRPPNRTPIVIEWSEYFLTRPEDIIKLDVNGDIRYFYDVGLELTAIDAVSPLRFRVYTENQSVEYEVKFVQNGVHYIPVNNVEVEVRVSKNREPLSKWFDKEPPVIRFDDGSFLIYNSLFKLPKANRQPFPKDRIEVWDWSGTDLKKESQKITKRPDSIQRKVILELLTKGYDVVFDDDETDEAADVIAIKVDNENLVFHFFHCKYSQESTPGARIDDLYVVCGQAQKSVYWKGDIEGLLKHLRDRESSRMNRNGVSRFELGDMKKLADIARQAPYLIPQFKISIVQPGLSKQKATTQQLDLLAVTELYLMETYAIDFGVIASP